MFRERVKETYIKIYRAPKFYMAQTRNGQTRQILFVRRCRESYVRRACGAHARILVSQVGIFPNKSKTSLPLLEKKKTNKMAPPARVKTKQPKTAAETKKICQNVAPFSKTNNCFSSYFFQAIDKDEPPWPVGRGRDRNLYRPKFKPSKVYFTGLAEHE